VLLETVYLSQEFIRAAEIDFAAQRLLNSPRSGGGA